MAFPNKRKRINRASRNVRNLVAETILHPHDFIAPLLSKAVQILKVKSHQCQDISVIR